MTDSPDEDWFGTGEPTEASGIVGEYVALRREAEADVLAMQMGDFYEFFGEDAELVGRELDLKVSQRSSGGENYSMAGVPVDDLAPYLKALVERGYRVAVADQHPVDDGHERRVDRVVTPGTLLDPSGDDAQYLATLVRGESGSEPTVGLAFLDVTTGRFHATAVSGPEAESRALTECYRFAPTEVLPGPDARNDDALLERLRESLGADGGETRLTLHDAEAFAPGRAKHTLREQFGDGAADSVGLDSEPAIQAAGAALAYVAETGAGALASVSRIQAYTPDDHVSLDATTQRNLELTEPMTGNGRSLFDTLDHTETSAGRRLLKEWLGRPRRDRAELERRQGAVAALAADAMARDRLRERLDGTYDLERLASRTASGSAGPDALLRVRETLAELPTLVDAVESSPRLADSPVADLFADLDGESAAEVREELEAALADDPPKSLTAGGLIRPSYDEELAELVERHDEAAEWLDTLADREKREYGLTHLSVGRNKTDGYYIQVGKSESDDVPEHYEAIKTLKNSERFVTEELEEREREIMRLEEQRGDLEAEVFRELREWVGGEADLLQAVGRAFAELDTLCALAEHAVRNDWTQPELTDEDVLDLQAARHPVVEQSVEFVPNDLRLDRDRRFLLVTGPNMSGKSTYMRQAALVTLLAQVGSFVPAREARVGLVDGVYTRVGALDELAQGRSTFMVEMQELSNILHNATEDSLVILDEVGRGTATYDGISIAWAATEYLHNEVRAKTLFATHYHELTSLAEHLPRVENVHVAAERDGVSASEASGGSPDSSGGDVTFLRTVRDGATDRSYGVHVADLAGVPAPVVERSRDVLDRLREEKAIEAKGSGSETSPDETVQAVFDLDGGEFTDGATADGGSDPEALDPTTESVLEELQGVDVEDTSPVELLSRVQEWQRRLDD
ncbi:DNA mismatch repair protein MutS [Haloglomus salinum]|uniref:DNA mismatch repair protein MutS n=1 Tax=Haloglomus salinum TaxID=2962673 RepID=UPI0020C940DC|nr:DNA mismatch repair protein MutS [Haloglomus salinum]